MKINLHTHSNCSDGTLNPKDVLDSAIRAGISFYSLTDHDTINGWLEIEDYIKTQKIKYIPGIELSTINHDYLHILGYNIDYQNKTFLNKLKDYKERRIERIKRIIKKLNNANIPISIEEISLKSNQTMGRPHLADLLVKKNFARNRSLAFQKYLIEGAIAYEPPLGPDIKEAIEDIKNAGGLAFLAHPSTVKDFYNLKEYKNYGLDGIEIFYPTHTNIAIEKYLKEAKEFSLLISAGTDFHGPGSGRDNINGFTYKEEYFFWVNDISKGSL